MRIKDVVKQFMPPIFLSAIQRGYYPFYGIKGDFANWAELQDFLDKHNLGNYDNENILSQVYEAIEQVRQGKAAYERDGVVFEKQEYNYPLLTALLRAINSFAPPPENKCA